MVLGLLLLGGIGLIAVGADRLRGGDKLLGVAGIGVGAAVTATAALAMLEWSPLFD